MTATAIDEFGIGRCRDCGRETLAIPDLDADGVWRCAHCDVRVEVVRWVDGAGLADLGYEIGNGEAARSGCTSCVTGGCAVQGARTT